jgi:hypothetical protein
MTKDLSCSCGELIIKSTAAGAKIRGKVLLWENGSLKSICKSCGCEVNLPMLVTESPQIVPKLVVSRKKVIDL